jgi:cation diffusion facilitator CzcD-associated flavoprotein CzcO
MLTITVTPEQKARFRNDPDHYLEFRTIIERDSNSVHGLTLKDSSRQQVARDDFTELMRQKLAKKPQIFKSLLPSFGVGCRRLTPGLGYLEALAEDNVDFIDTPITEARSTSLILENGEEKTLDVLVCATGKAHSTCP